MKDKKKKLAIKRGLLFSIGAVLIIGFALISYQLMACKTTPATKPDDSASHQGSKPGKSISASTGDLQPGLSDSGSSVQGRKFNLYRYAGKKGKIIIVGGIHGNESEAVIFSQALVDHLNAQEPGFLAKEIIVVPILNPDGHAAGTRKNAHGVDINRNFPTRDFQLGDPGHKYYGGEKAGSEPETRFLLKLMETEKPELLVMLHTPYNFVNSDGDILGLGPKLAKEMGLEYHESMDYPTPGSVGTYFGKERQIPVITVEFPPAPDVWKRFGEKLLKTLLN